MSRGAPDEISTRERELCAKLKAAKRSNLVPDSKWNLVGIKWMKQWMNYVNFDGFRSPYTDHTHPGPMDQSPLLSEQGQLRRNMLEDLDYALVPHELYQAFEEEYGGGPPIVRNVVPCSGSRTIFMVDLYPVHYNIYLYDGAEDGTTQTTDATDDSSAAGGLPEQPRVTIELSKYTGFDDVKAAVWAALGMPEEPNRYNIWLRSPEYFSTYKSSAAEAPATPAQEGNGPRYLTSTVADALPGSWVHLREDIIYTHHYPNGVMDVMIELLEEEPPLDTLPADPAEKQLATEDREDSVARKGLLSRWLRDLRVGDVVDGKDNTGKWFEAVVVPLPETAGGGGAVPGSVRLHFKCWSTKWDDTVSPQDIPSRVWPLYSKTPNWRAKLRAGQKTELLVSRPEEVPHWVIAVVSSVDHTRGFVKVRYDHNSVQDFKTLPIQSEKLCMHPTHNAEQQGPTASDTSATSTSYLTSYRSAGSSWMSSGRSHETGPLQAGGAPGVVGLRNLGNTCFMNSMLQCLSHAKPLTDVFLSDSYLEQINTTNVLGMGGKIANVYGRLLKDMWSQRYSVVNPYEFKDTIGQFQPQFAGYQQQDSQEFMLYLLDGLHEDMNRVQKKPFVEKIESRGRPDDLISREAWRRFLLRNDSELVDRVFGQLKSHVTCRNCGHQSVTFDEFNSLALPVPVKNTRRITVTLYPLPPGSVPIILTVEVELMARIKDLKDAMVAAVGPEVLGSGTFTRRCLKRGYDQADDSGDTDGMDVDGLGGESYVLVGSGDSSPSSCSGDGVTAGKGISKSTSAMDIVLPPSPPEAGDESTQASPPVYLHVTSYATYSKKVTGTLQDDSPVQDVMKQGSTQQLYVFQLENDASPREYHDYDTTTPGYNYSTLMSVNDRPAPTEKGVRFVDIVMMKRPTASANQGQAAPTTYYSTYNYNSQYPSVIGPSARLTYEIGVTRHMDLYATIERLALGLLPEGSPFEDYTRSGDGAVSRDSDDEQLPPAPFKVMYSNAHGNNVADEFPYGSEATIDSILPRHQLVCLWSEDALGPVGSPNSPSPESDSEDATREAKTVAESLFRRRRLLSDGLSAPYVAPAEAIPGAPRASSDDAEGGGRRRVSIDACLDKFIEREVMPDEETWFCPACKEHKSPIKKFDLWATPEILIVQLKRFQYIPGSYFIHREKISDLVDFPVEGLDLTRYVRGEQMGISPPMYDLFAVSEHSGGLGGGHYTAVAKTPDTDEWINYNDSHCSRATADDIVTPAAYILFYKRRGAHVKWAGIEPLPLGVLDEEKSSPDLRQTSPRVAATNYEWYLPSPESYSCCAVKHSRLSSYKKNGRVHEVPPKEIAIQGASGL